MKPRPDYNKGSTCTSTPSSLPGMHTWYGSIKCTSTCGSTGVRSTVGPVEYLYCYLLVLVFSTTCGRMFLLRLETGPVIDSAKNSTYFLDIPIPSSDRADSPRRRQFIHLDHFTTQSIRIGTIMTFKVRVLAWKRAAYFLPVLSISIPFLNSHCDLSPTLLSIV